MKGEVAAKKCEIITREGGSFRPNLQDAFKKLPSWGRRSKRTTVMEVKTPNEEENRNTNVVKSKNDNETREKTRNSENEKNKKQLIKNADNDDNNTTSNALLSSSSTSTFYPSSTKARNQMIYYNPSSTISSTGVAPRQNEFLFEKALHQNDVNDLNRLLIPRKFAETYFPCLKITKDMHKKETLVFFDHKNIAWEMKFEFWEFSQSYVLTRGWKAFVNQYQLRPNFTIRFYRPDQCQDKKHYAIRYIVRVVNKAIRLFGQNIHYLCLDDVNDHNSINGGSSSGENGRNELDGQREIEEAAINEDTGH
ncbi:AP2/ERF and B3 domain-containing transcription factor RAV1-like isoform X2 [Macadamia integrifolia]|uniref:AP2/ERF and B3 domain-containing transcription factor RAV1-like isoform X2 n=1 Tax=Macadamia integrifolia TaxID=60698 RepID=UPI001C4FB9A3|nr:AP2/ERF and B3 domain-containing transcription factor RAV1-like isoform X2 [Macadamia integrifolia]